MTNKKVISDTELKRIKELEAIYAYAEYKTRLAGDLDSDLDDWAKNIICFIENEKSKK